MEREENTIMGQFEVRVSLYIYVITFERKLGSGPDFQRFLITLELTLSLNSSEIELWSLSAKIVSFFFQFD